MFKFNLTENEEILNIYRQTEAVLYKPVIIIFILIYFPWYFLLKYEIAARYSHLLLFWTFLVFIYALNKYLVWLLNVYMVTNKRLITVNYQNLFNKKVFESPLDRILNVSFSTKGFWQSVLRFGTVEAQVAGLHDPITLKNISRPAEAKDFLWEVHNKYLNGL